MTVSVDALRTERKTMTDKLENAIERSGERELTVAQFLQLAAEQGVAVDDALLVLGDLLSRKTLTQSVRASLIVAR